MKKLLLGLLLLLVSLTMSACVPTEDLFDQVECGPGTVLLGNQCVIDNINPDPDPDPVEDPEEIDYSYDLEDIPDELEYYLGESSYSWISQWFETDYNLDGEVDEDELELSYTEMLELFEEDGIVTLTLEDVSDMDWCIDGWMPQEFIDAAIYAIEYYDGIEWVNAEWTVEYDDCTDLGYKYTFSWTDQLTVYLDRYDSYIEQGYAEELAVEMAFLDATNVIGYNSLMLDVDNENYFDLEYTDIFFVYEAMYDMTQDELNFVALHEISHTFGLDDIYDEEFIGHTLMYGRAGGQEELVPELRPFDLYNLYYIYHVEEEEVTE